jgi:hypothetical protein
MYPRNAASPPTIDLGQILQLSDGTVQTSGASVRVKIGTGAWGAGAGSLDCDATSGIWTYAPTQAETDDAFFVVAAYKSGCSALSKTVITSASATAGYAGLDWSKINAPTTTVGLSGTTIKTATDVETDTQDIQSRLPATLDSGNMRSSVQNIGAVADGVWDEAYADHNIAGSFGKLLNTIRKANLAIEGEVTNAITPTTLTFSSNISATTSAYAHAVLLFVDGPLSGENSPIISYNNTNGVFVLEEPLTAAPSSGDEFVVIAGSHVHDIASIQSGLATSAGVTAGFTEIKGASWSSATDTLEKIADAAGGGGTSIMVTPVVAQTPVRVVGSNISTFIGDLSTIRIGVFSSSDPVDLTAFGDLEVCVQQKNGTDLDFVEMADLTIDGDDSNYISWEPSGPSVSDVTRGKWSLRKASNKQVIAYGAWIVEDAALEDVGS